MPSMAEKNESLLTIEINIRLDFYEETTKGLNYFNPVN